MSLDHYKAQFDSFISTIYDETEAVLEARRNAFNNFVKLGLPSKKQELWQFTDLSALTKTRFDIPKSPKPSIDVLKIENISIPNCNKIVIVNGIIDNKLSDFGNLSVKNVQDDQISNTDLSDNTDSFVSLNNAFVNGGYHIEIDDNHSDNNPIHIINIVGDDKNYIQNHQLNIIKVGKNSSVSVIEEFISNGVSTQFYNAVNKIEISENSNLKYSIFQNNESNSIKFNNLFIHQKNDSSFSSQIITKNGSLIRNNVNIQINGKNCESNISGLGLLDGHDHIENYTIVNHNEPHCNSKQLFKYILKDSAEGVFNGLVKVLPDAQQTDSQQTNRNILLSKKALMNSNPQLEIYADDVKCAHGSATGELDEDSIFYLRSRGIDQTTAKSLLIEGFAKEVIELVDNDVFKNKINDILLRWLSI